MPSSDDSKSATAKVGDIRLTKILMEKSKKMENLEGTDLYAVPLTRSSTQISPSTFNRFVFDFDQNGPSIQIEEHKTILLVGAADPGKTSLIDSLFNFVVGVDWNDPFRFRLNEDGQEETQSISVYEIRHADGFLIPFSLTIVDVCVDTPKHDFAEMLGNFLLSGAIQQLELIGFVGPTNSVPSPSCESVMSLFGKDLKENLNCLWAFAGVKQEPSESNTFLKSIPGHEFQCLEFLSANGHNDPSSRAACWKSFEDFFRSLAKRNPIGLSQTKQVLEERKRLEVTFGELRSLREEMEQAEKMMIADCQVKIEANKNIKTTQKTNLPSGFLATNCNNCGVTCSVHRSLLINTPSCLICPEKCDWNLHSINVSYGLNSTIEDAPPDAKDVNKLKTCSEKLEKLIDEQGKNSKNQKCLRLEVNVKIEELDKISLCPFFMTPEYADLMI